MSFCRCCRPSECFPDDDGVPCSRPFDDSRPDTELDERPEEAAPAPVALELKLGVSPFGIDATECDAECDVECDDEEDDEGLLLVE